MNQEASGLLCVGMHETDGAEESHATECPKVNQDSSHETAKFDAVVATSAMYSDHSNANSCLDEYQHIGMMAGIQPVEEIRFGSTQHFELPSQGIIPDSEEESLSSSPETSSTTNYDMPDYMEQNLQHIYTALDEMVDKEGPVMLNPEFVMCDTTLHLEPHLTFSSHGFKIEYLDWGSCEDDEMICLYWEISDIICIACKWTQSVGSALITLLVGSGAETRNSGSVRVKFCLTDLQWPRKQQKIWHLASRYQEIWNNIPSDDFALENWSIEPSLFFPKQYFSDTGDFEDVIYPKGEPDAVSISKRDVELLLPETFVNDTIIDFYIKYLSTRIEPTEMRRYHFFNSFFFRKLADLDKDQGRVPEGRAAFLRVRKWTRKINLFEKDILFIPVNFNLHWSLIVICYPGEVETFEDGDTKISAKVPCILHMDSLKGSHSGLKDIIQSYLWEEWKERHPESASDNSDKFLNLRFVSLELPQQDNSFDCGLFLLHYVELFLMDAPSGFNPLKIDVFSSFLSEDWFPPAEASLKRSLIQKLIHGLVTEPSQNYPKLTFSNEQLDERHQRSEDAEREPAREFLTQRCSAGEPDSVCTILGTQQPSTSICLNDSDEKGVPASGCILETGRVSMVAVQNLQELGICPPDKDTVVCLSSQDEKNEPPLADTDNQLDLRSCASEDAEVLKGSVCVVKDKYTHEESLLDSLDNNRKISSQAEVEVHDTMDSMSCSISDNAKLAVACQEHSLERNTIVEDERCGASQDMHLSMMLDASKDDVGPDPERTTGEAEDGRCNLSEDTDSVTIGDINKDVAEHSLEMNIVEAEDTKREDSVVDPIMVEDAIKDNLKETSTTVDEINDSEQYVSSELKEGNNDNGMTMTTGSTVFSELKEGNTSNVLAGGSTNGTNETHADGEDAYVNIVTCQAAPCEDDTDSVTIGDINKDVAEHSLERNIVEAEDTKREDSGVDPITVEDVIKDNLKETSTTVDEINDSEQYVSSELKEGNNDNGMTTGSTVFSELKEGNTFNVMAGGSTNGTNETRADGEDAYVNLVTGQAVPCEDDTTCPDAVMPLVDSTCSAKNETILENTTSDAKRPLPDSTCEAEDIVVSDDQCLQKDVQGTDAKIERHYKRRKVVPFEVDKRHTRNSSRAPSLD